MKRREAKKEPDISLLSSPSASSSSSSSSSSATEEITIPRYIHFIWFGTGTNSIMPYDYFSKVVTQWKEKNPNHQCRIWVDVATSGIKAKNPLEVLADSYKENYGDHFTIKDEKESKQILLKDIHTEHLRTQYIGYELEKMDPNYGAASDLLRYSIIYQYGGIYIDIDVGPNLNFSLDDSGIFTTTKHHVLYVDHFSQRPLINEEQQRVFTLNDIGSDTLICSTPRNPVVAGIKRLAEEKYHLEKLSEIFRAAHSMDRNRQDNTVSRTGPDLIKHYFKPLIEAHHGITALDKDQKIPIGDNGLLFIGKVGEQVVEIRCARPNPSKALTNPHPSAHSWINVPESKTDAPIEALIEQVMKTITFEAEFFHFLRLDHHVELLISKTSESYCSDIVSRLTKKLESVITTANSSSSSSSSSASVFYLSQNTVEYVALTLKFEDTIAFCQKFFKTSLRSLLTLELESQYYDAFKDVIAFETQYGFLINLMGKISSQCKDNAEKLNFMVDDPRRISKDTYKKIKLGVDFIDAFISHYEANNPNLIIYCIDRLKETIDIYEQYVVLFNVEFNSNQVPDKVTVKLKDLQINYLREKIEKINQKLITVKQATLQSSASSSSSPK